MAHPVLRPRLPPPGARAAVTLTQDHLWQYCDRALIAVMSPLTKGMTVNDPGKGAAAFLGADADGLESGATPVDRDPEARALRTAGPPVQRGDRGRDRRDHAGDPHASGCHAAGCGCRTGDGAPCATAPAAEPRSGARKRRMRDRRHTLRQDGAGRPRDPLQDQVLPRPLDRGRSMARNRDLRDHAAQDRSRRPRQRLSNDR